MDVVLKLGPFHVGQKLVVRNEFVDVIRLQIPREEPLACIL